MKVSALIQALQAMPPDADVGHIWDGAMRTNINFVWLARSGKVATADYDQVVYYDEDRPETAPRSTQSDGSHWHTPPDPDDDDDLG